jgi:Protein of unknown function (DUF2917)
MMVGSSERFVFRAAPETSASAHALSPEMVIRFIVQPGQTASWRVRSDSELRVGTARVWVTRIFSPYDYWLQTGDVLRVSRGERIWLSTDANIAAEISLTSAYAVARRPLFKWIERLRDCLADISLLRSR